MIKFNFSEEKATQVAAEFLSRSPSGELDDVVLMKLMYFADRESLELFDQPIIGDRLFCMENGPVLSRVLTLFNASHGKFTDYSPVDPEESIFLQYIRRDEGKVSMLRSSDLKKLSRAEKAIIERVFAKYGNLPRERIVEAAHELCEYVETPAKQRKPLRYEDVLKSVGRTADEITTAQHRASIATRIRDWANMARKRSGTKSKKDAGLEHRS